MCATTDVNVRVLSYSLERTFKQAIEKQLRIVFFSLSHFPGFCALKVQRAQHLHGDFFNALFHRLERTILLLLRGSSIAEKSTSQICPDSVRLFSNAAACCLLTSSWHSCVFQHLTFWKNLPFFAISWTTVLGNCAAAFEQYWSLNS